MLSQEVEEKLADILVQRINQLNTSILKKIGSTVKTMSTLSVSEAYRLQQMLKYGGDIQEIAKELSQMTGKSIQEIYEIFEQVATNNKQFARKFYEYRGMDYIPYKDDVALQNQVKSIASLTTDLYKNISNTTGIGFLFKGIDGQIQFKNIMQSYDEIIDRGILAITQGKDNFYSVMRNTLKEIGGSGLVVYESGRTRRLDSAVRMNVLDGMRQLNNETSKRFGAEYDADGVEISVHLNPAPDHADIQGRQFSNEEYEKLESGLEATDYKGHKYDGADKRQISHYNCYHKIFTIVLGVSEPEYTDKQLREIQQKNTDGFDYEGKHYTIYEGTQLQRRIETEIRKQKDINILAKASGDDTLVNESQSKIRQLKNKYNKLCQVSGLKPQNRRMSVPGYRR